MRAFLTADAHVADSATVAIESFRRHHPHWVVTVFHAEPLPERFIALARDRGVALIKLPSPEPRIAGRHCSEFSDRVTAAMVLRLGALDHLLDHTDVERVLYLDTDTFTQGPIPELERRPDSEGALIGCAPELNGGKPQWLIEHLASWSHDYFNSGVLLFELDRIRPRIGNLLDDYVARCEAFRYPDQDYLNERFPPETHTRLPEDVNSVPFLNSARPERDKRADRLVHFFVASKPWNAGSALLTSHRHLPYEAYWKTAEALSDYLSERFLRTVRSVGLTAHTRRR